MFSYSRREALELRRDPVRSTLALLGTVILMLIMGYGISMDVENLRFAVLDRDQTVSSRAWSLNLAGSRYFIEQPPLASYDELDRRMRSGELAVAIEIPPNFGRDIARGTPAQIGVWVDGAMPSRAETVKGTFRRCTKAGCRRRQVVSRTRLNRPGCSTLKRAIVITRM